MEKCNIVISGESASGKDTIAKAISKMTGMQITVSCTTRSPREGEIDGKDYFFLSPEEFEQKIKLEELAEWDEYQKGVYYGTPAQEFLGDRPKIAVLTPAGAIAVRKCLKNKGNTNVILVYVTAPLNIRVKRYVERQHTFTLKDFDSLSERIHYDAYTFEGYEREADIILYNDGTMTPEKLAEKVVSKIEKSVAARN